MLKTDANYCLHSKLLGIYGTFKELKERYDELETAQLWHIVTQDQYRDTLKVSTMTFETLIQMKINGQEQEIPD